MILQLVVALANTPSRRGNDKVVTITVDAGAKPLRTFDPRTALGAGVDGHDEGEIAKIYTSANLRRMQSAGLRSITYRLRTELGIEAWHWNPHGSWSDPEHARGYWTSDARPSGPIGVCYGYRLPRRGSTIDQANNDGYSRILDGDLTTFWKSNPYLDRTYTGEDNARHPQWIVIDTKRRVYVNAIRIDWGEPFARRFKVQYWYGSDDPYDDSPEVGDWRTFDFGSFDNGRGGAQTARLSRAPVSARYFRILLIEGSNTAPAGSTDRRDRLGFAVREIQLGRIDPSGSLHDVLRHGRTNQTQSLVYVSSTDPWHRASDRDPNVEQPGIDRLTSSKLCLPGDLLIPAGVLYDTPENGAALLRYLKARGAEPSGIEAGEEPDEQYVEPEDFGALYLQVVSALRAVDSTIPIGGPSLETIVNDVRVWPSADRRPWLARLTSYLQKRHELGTLAFLSFEWYPFDKTDSPASPNLIAAPSMLASAVTRLRKLGLPRDLPLMITEFGYSAFSCRPEVDTEGALFDADTFGTALALGIRTTYLYGFEPAELIQERPGAWGGNMMFLRNDDDDTRPVPTYWAARMVTQDWLDPAGGEHALQPVTVSGASHGLTTYAVRRTDGRVSLLILNKDANHPYSIRLNVRNGSVNEPTGKHDLSVVQYSHDQYRWRPNGPLSRPSRNLPPRRWIGNSAGSLTLPPTSITVVGVRR